MHTVAPGGTIGIIGGGQLGRMMVTAAAELGYHAHIYCPSEFCPAAQVSPFHTNKPYDDEAALKAFAESVDVVTFEFENIPHSSVALLEDHVHVFPGTLPLYEAKNRLREKAFFDKNDVPTNDYREVDSAEAVKAALKDLGVNRAVLKIAEEGYDGKGQAVIKPDSDIDALWQDFEGKQTILEAFVAFEREISVVLARGQDGEIVPFPVGDNLHVGGILDTSTVPARVDAGVVGAAIQHAAVIAEALNYVGVMAVEFFVTLDGEVLANEIAPRPHNSGHWTMDGCATSQFEQHVRAVCGLPLGPVDLLRPTRMKNLIGDEVNQWPEIIGQADAKLHLYGKKAVRPGRKMGHVNYTGS